MSRALPAHANLDHLRKQAKDLLRELQHERPGSKLADAQHAIAREYGLASWPTLKAHVESLARRAEPAGALVAVPSQGNDAPSAEVHLKANSFVGSWTANVAKSKRHPANQFQSATLQFAVVGDTVTITNVGVDASGQEEHGENTIQADGREHPSEHGNGYVLMARWLGAHVLETVAKKDGQVVGRGTYEVSADGKTLTVSAKDASANAHSWRTDFDQVIVLDRR